MVNANDKAKANEKDSKTEQPELELGVPPVVEPKIEGEPEVEVAKPKRLSAIERLTKQLEDAKAKAAARDNGKLDAAQIKLGAARAALVKAQEKVIEASDEVKRLTVNGGNDPIVTAEVESAAKLEA